MITIVANYLLTVVCFGEHLPWDDVRKVDIDIRTLYIKTNIQSYLLTCICRNRFVGVPPQTWNRLAFMISQDASMGLVQYLIYHMLLISLLLCRRYKE